MIDHQFNDRRMLMFPAGNNSDHISLYVDFASASERKPGWSRTVQFSMRIHNPEDERAEIFKGTW